MSRNLALILIFIIIMGGSFLIGVFAAPPLIKELNALTNRIPQYSIEMQKIIDSVTYKYQRFKLPSTFQLVVDNVVERVQSIILQFVERTTEVIIGILSRFFSLIMAPILAFYMLKDIEMIKKNFWTLIPKGNRKDIKQLLKKIDKVLLDYLKGQLLVSLLVGLLSILGLYLLNLNFYLIIGIFAGIMNLIPYLGVVVGTLPAIFVASFRSFRTILGVIAMFTFIQQLEGSLISPKIVGDKVGLHPILIIFSLLVGGELLGIIGMLIAVPIVGVIKVILNHYISRVIKRNKGES